MKNWLASHGVTATEGTATGEWLHFSVPAAKANEMFAANYATYEHTASGSTGLRSLSVSVPADISHIVDAIVPGTS